MKTVEDARELLERRAARLSERPASRSETPTVEVVTVRVAGRRYAVEASHVSRILRAGQTCRLPAGSHDLLVLVLVGGTAAPVADLGSLLMLSDPDPTRPLVVLLEGAGLPLGLLVDEVEAFGQVVETAHRHPAGPAEAVRPVERDITADGVVLLDAAVLLADRRTSALRADLNGSAAHSSPGEP